MLYWLPRGTTTKSKKKKTFILGRSLRLSSRDLPLMLQLFSLVTAILQSLGSIYCRFQSISQCSVICPFLCISFIIVYSTFWPIFSTSAFVIVLNFKFCELASTGFLLRVFIRGYTRVCFIACQTWHPTKLVEINLAQQNAIISAIHLTHTTSALPAERQVRAMIRV